MRQVHKVVLMVVDFDDLGEEGIIQQLESARRLPASVREIDTRDIDWDDSHPLNSETHWREKFDELFGSATAVAVQVDALTDEQLYNFWMYRDCISAIQAGDMRGQFISAARAVIAATRPAPRPTDDDLWDKTLLDRDEYHEWADKLAEQIAALTATDIGEHSSENNPWQNALDAINEYWELAKAAPVQPETELLDIVRTFVCIADRMAELTDAQREFYPSPLSDCSPLMQQARLACVERGFTAGGLSVDGAAPVMPPIAEALHYPDCWDVAAYPTLTSALAEVYAWFKCSGHKAAPVQAAPEGLVILQARSPEVTAWEDITQAQYDRASVNGFEVRTLFTSVPRSAS